MVGTGFLPSMLISKLDFCGSNQINHLFCYLAPLMQLSCPSIYITEMIIFILSVAMLCICFFLTLLSNIFIVPHIESSLNNRQDEDISHMWPSPGCCHYLQWTHDFNVCLSKYTNMYVCLNSCKVESIKSFLSFILLSPHY